MAILLSNEILNSVKMELQSATSSVQIITAYCKEKTLLYLNNCIGENVKEKNLMLRFRMDDVIKGSTDFSAVKMALETGWNVYVRFDLHAKTYVIDNKRGLVGSANATNAGLSIGRLRNMEIATLIDIEEKDIEKIRRLFDEAIRIDRSLLMEMEKQVNAVSVKDSNLGYNWDSKIIKLFHPNIETLFSYELPEEFTFTVGTYFSFIDEVYTGQKDKIKESFRWSNSYLWLLKTLKENDNCMYFGELCAKLHSAVISDPKPYRREVKQMLSNLLDFVEMLNMEEIVVDRPNYSQRIRIRK